MSRLAPVARSPAHRLGPRRLQVPIHRPNEQDYKTAAARRTRSAAARAAQWPVGRRWRRTERVMPHSASHAPLPMATSRHSQSARPGASVVSVSVIGCCGRNSRPITVMATKHVRNDSAGATSGRSGSHDRAGCLARKRSGTAPIRPCGPSGTYSSHPARRAAWARPCPNSKPSGISWPDHGSSKHEPRTRRRPRSRRSRGIPRSRRRRTGTVRRTRGRGLPQHPPQCHPTRPRRRTAREGRHRPDRTTHARLGRRRTRHDPAPNNRLKPATLPATNASAT